MKKTEKISIALLGKILTVILMVLICCISFGGIYVADRNKTKNLIEDYKFGNDLYGSRNIVIKVSNKDSESTSNTNNDENEQSNSEEQNTTSEENAETENNEETNIEQEENTSLENYLKTKKIIEQRLKYMGVEDYTIRLNKDDGTMLSQALKRIGGNADVLEDALLKKNDMSAFIECHIEQGRILFDKKESVGVVKKITGIYREEIRVLGEANHAGTTLMKYRHDSFLSTAEAALELERIVKEVNREDVVGTVGRVNVFPNSANIISGDVEFIIEIRTPNNEIKEEIIRKFTLSLKDIEEKRNVKFERKVILNQAEVNMDKDIINALKSSIEELGMPVIDMVSMAGHDSVHMCDITKTGMLFVQSIDGKSHCKEENTDMKDIERAGNVLLNTVLKLDKEVD